MEPPCFIKSLIDCLEMKKNLSSGKKYIFLHMAAEEFTFPTVRSFELPLQTQMQISLSSHLTHSLSLLSYEVCCIWLLYEESRHAGFFTSAECLSLCRVTDTSSIWQHWAQTDTDIHTHTGARWAFCIMFCVMTICIYALKEEATKYRSLLRHSHFWLWIVFKQGNSGTGGHGFHFQLRWAGMLSFSVCVGYFCRCASGL